jgi:hypothetical protein
MKEEREYIQNLFNLKNDDPSQYQVIFTGNSGKTTPKPFFKLWYYEPTI